MKMTWAIAGACVAACVSAPTAAAENQLGIKVGEIVYDRDGGTIGTIRSVTDDVAVVDTGAKKITLGLDSFRRRDGRLTLPMDRATLEGAAAKVQAEGDAAVLGQLVPGAPFVDSAGETVGTIVAVEGQKVTVEAGTLKAEVPLSAFVTGPKGPAIGATRADFLARLDAMRPKMPAKAETPKQ